MSFDLPGPDLSGLAKSPFTEMAEIAAANVATYDALAATYELEAPRSLELLGPLVEELAPFIRDRSIAFDIGCAVGASTLLLARHVDRVDAIDISPEMVARARLRLAQACPNATVRTADFMALQPVPAYECVTMFSVAHLFPKRHLPSLLTRMHGFMVPGAIGFIDTTLHIKPSEGLEVKRDAVGHQVSIGPKRYRARWTKDEILGVVREVGSRIGLEIIDTIEVEQEGKTWFGMTLLKLFQRHPHN